MKDNKYQQLVKKHAPKEDKLKHALIAFLVGGTLGLIANILVTIFNSFGISSKDSAIIVLLIYIFLACLFTSLGFFDNLVAICLCGLIIPITGFAHSICSSMLDYKKDGLVTGIGSNSFKLAGSVILYGILSAFILVIIKVILYG